MDGRARTEAAHTVLFCGKQGVSKFKAMKILSVISKLHFKQLK